MSTPLIPAYKIGDPLVTTGQKIAEVIGQTNSSGVYITEEGQIRWEYYANNRVVPDLLRPAIKKYEDIAQIARRTFRQGRRQDARRELANALRAALETPTGTDPLDALEDVKANFNGQYASKAATRYVCGSLVSALVLFGLSYLARSFGSEESKLVATGAIAGVAGSLISVLLRIRSIEASASPLWYWSIEGSLRTLLGSLFGGFTVILIKANIILGLASQNSFASFTISIVAGFSERLVPNILKNLEEKHL
ncbi:MAG: hypothetical protein DMF75_17500 [Acidobacteria bacterium]|nr:MAG: hypothetical protein DMF75_17500 [Acidobacteriota bacterium]